MKDHNFTRPARPQATRADTLEAKLRRAQAHLRTFVLNNQSANRQRWINQYVSVQNMGVNDHEKFGDGLRKTQPWRYV